MARKRLHCGQPRRPTAEKPPFQAPPPSGHSLTFCPWRRGARTACWCQAPLSGGRPADRPAPQKGLGGRREKRPGTGRGGGAALQPSLLSPTHLPMSVPALQPPCPSPGSRARILKEASGVEPGCVEIIPRKRVTVQVRTWLLSAQTGRRVGREAVEAMQGQDPLPPRAHPPPSPHVLTHPLPASPQPPVPEMRCFSDSITFVTGLRWTAKVWKSWGPEPTVSGCWTITRTMPELVP